MIFVEPKHFMKAVDHINSLVEQCLSKAGLPARWDGTVGGTKNGGERKFDTREFKARNLRGTKIKRNKVGQFTSP